MNVYMVLAYLGNGGKGGAVTHRANMFSRAGHSVTIVVLNYQPSLEKSVEEKRSLGRIDPKVNVVNLFDSVSAAVDLSARRSIFRRIREGRRSFSAPKFNSELELSHDLVFERDDEGRIARAWRYEQNKLIEEAYFTSRERLYARRIYKKGKPSAVEVYDPTVGAFERFRNLSQWQTTWLTKLVENEDSHPVILCDSQAKMAPILTHLKPEVATRIGILHANHFDEPPYALGSVVKPNDDRFLRRLGELDALVTLTQAQADDIAEEYGHADRIHVIPNVVKDVAMPELDEYDKRATIFARLSTGKRIGDAIEAFTKVIEAAPGATLDIYGRGRDRDKLQKLIDENELTDVVRLRGFTSQARREMAASTVTLLPTDTEGLPLTIVESLLCGTPAISYDVNYGPSELIDDGVDGVLVPHADVDALASAIIELLNDPERAKRMGAQGRDKVRKKYSEEVVMTQWEDLLSDLERS